MKLRIRGNAIRLRLGQSDLRTLIDQGTLTHTLRMPGANLHYGIELSEAHAFEVCFEHNTLRVTLPRDAAHTWCNTAQVGFDSEHAWEGGVVRLVVEKDWQCAAPRPGDDDTDAFPHPTGQC